MSQRTLTQVSLSALLAGAGMLCLGATCAGAVRQEGVPVDIRRDATVDAVERALPSVVNIGTETLVETRDPFTDMLREFWDPYYRGRPPAAQYSLGSGVIIDDAGYVLTNEHVVRRASRIWVKLSDGREFEADRVAGTSKSDVALLKLRNKENEKFVPVRFAPEDDLMLGETVIALGNPFGLGGTVSRGILSSKNRRIPKENEPLDVADWLQTDAAINPGNSGGALVNLHGDLIGINVAVYREGQGIGFAIPIKRVSEALSQCFTPEETKSLWFGARVKAGTDYLSIISVEPASPADRAGLKVGDNVQQINGRAAHGFIDFSKELNSAGTNHNVDLVVRRGSERKNLSVRLIPEKDYFNAALIQKKLGITVQELTRELADRMGFSYFGFVIAEVDKDGPGAKAELQKYFIIQGANGETPQDVVELAKLINRQNAGEKIKLDLAVPVNRGGFRAWRGATTTVTVK